MYCQFKVFQKRFDGSVDFYRNWAEYRDGFGDMKGEFWLGNNKVSKMTEQGNWELRVDMGDWRIPMVKAYAKYKYFRLGGSDESYQLQFDRDSFNGTAGGNYVDSSNKLNYSMAILVTILSISTLLSSSSIIFK